MASRFKELEVDQVEVGAFDVFTSGFPEGIEFTRDVPQLMIFPAYSKRPPFKRYVGDANGHEIMQFVQKHADIKFALPEYPFFTPEELERYQQHEAEKKRVADDEEQKRVLEEETKRERKRQQYVEEDENAVVQEGWEEDDLDIVEAQIKTDL